MSTVALRILTVLILCAVSYSAITDYCLSGSQTNSAFNGNYAVEPGVDSNGNTYYKRCDEYLYQYKLGTNWYWQFSRELGSSKYNIKCANPNLLSANLCDQGTWQSGSSTESTIDVVDEACFVPEISCSNLLLQNTESMDCNGLFIKESDNLYSRESPSNCGYGTGEKKYWYYNERFRRFECGDEDKRDQCYTGIHYFTIYSTDPVFGTIIEGQKDVPVTTSQNDYNTNPATLSCGVEEQELVIPCETIAVTGSNYCDGIFLKKDNNIYEDAKTGRFWFQYAYNVYSTAYNKMMCTSGDQSKECSPRYMTGDIATTPGIPTFVNGKASVPLNVGTALFECNVPISPAKMENYNEDKSSGYKKEIEVEAIATFQSSDCGVDGTVKVDENGNMFVDLDVSKLDVSACIFSDKEEIVFEYAIYTKYDYDDVKSRTGEECISDIIGEVYNPFDTPKCSATNKNGDTYFDCSIGDLSGRFGDAIPDNNSKIIVKGNISVEKSDNESGFCLSRLTPESLYQRSIVFICKDNKSTKLFCAPFQITKREI